VDILQLLDTSAVGAGLGKPGHSSILDSITGHGQWVALFAASGGRFVHLLNSNVMP
jgi:hypothetical protein